MCCCGNGVGTSLVMQMTIEEALAHLGVEDVEVLFGSLSDLSESRADLFVVSEEVLPGLPWDLNSRITIIFLLRGSEAG